MIEVKSLLIYPVKGLRGLSKLASAVDLIGLQGDRRWLIVDQDGRFQTQRQLARMAQIEVDVLEGGIELKHHDFGVIFVREPVESAEKVTVQIWRDQVSALKTTDADGFLSRVLGLHLCLVYLSDPAARPVDPLFGSVHDHVSFADGYPILAASTSSLADLEKRADKPFDMRRFRPNIVFSGESPWAEDRWRVVRIGAVTFRIVKPCSRCVVTTLNPETGENADANEPLDTLGRMHRGRGGGIMFGQNLIPNEEGFISVGDAVTVLETGPSNLL